MTAVTAAAPSQLPGDRVVRRRDTERQTTVLVRGEIPSRDGRVRSEPDVESLMLGHLRAVRATPVT